MLLFFQIVSQATLPWACFSRSKVAPTSYPDEIKTLSGGTKSGSAAFTLASVFHGRRQSILPLSGATATAPSPEKKMICRRPLMVYATGEENPALSEAV